MFKDRKRSQQRRQESGISYQIKSERRSFENFFETLPLLPQAISVFQQFSHTSCGISEIGNEDQTAQVEQPLNQLEPDNVTGSVKQQEIVGESAGASYNEKLSAFLLLKRRKTRPSVTRV